VFLTITGHPVKEETPQASYKVNKSQEVKV